MSPLFSLADLILAVSRQLSLYDEGATGGPTPLETTVRRYVARNPGTTAGAAAAATLLQPSNFSRALRSLEAKGFIRREHDEHDARSVRLHPTERAAANLDRLDAMWSAMLDGILDDGTRDTLIAALERIEHELAERRRPG